MKDETFSDLLISRAKLETLRFLLNNKNSDFTIKELSDNIEASYTTVNNFVKDLENFGIVKLREKGSAILVKINNNSPYISVLEELGSIDARPLRQLAEDFAVELETNENTAFKQKNIYCVVLFGSVARGLPKRDSDIDILVLARDNMDDLEEKAETVADKLGRDTEIQISPLVMKKKNFKRNLRSGDPLAIKIKEEGKALKYEDKWREIIDE